MKLNCGPTTEERYYAKQRYLNNWHTFFALWPRRIGDSQECRWLETIERRGKYQIHYAGGYWEWEYRIKVNETPVSGPGGIED